MKVLHVCDRYGPNEVGGVQQAIYQTTRSTFALGIRHQVLSLSGSPQADIDLGSHSIRQCKTQLTLANTPLSLTALQEFAGLSEDCDLVHYHFPYPFADVMHLVTQHDKPSLVTYHTDLVASGFWQKAYLPVMRRFFASVDQIVTTSSNYLASSHLLQSYRNKVEVIPFGLDPASYPQAHSSNVRRWRQKFGSRFYLFIGTLRAYKGLPSLIDAARYAGYPVVIAGSGPMQQELEAMAATQGNNNLHFLGRISEQEKMDLLEACYALVCPSEDRAEAFGFTLLEASMRGKPLITCEIGTGTSYINIKHETGLVVPPREPAKLAAAMEFLWEHPEYAEKMGICAQQRFYELFTAERMASRYADVYHQLLAGQTTTVAAVHH